MIRYKIYQNQQKKGLNAGKWFARAVSDETFDLAKLAEHMSKHNSPYSGGVIKGVLSDMVCLLYTSPSPRDGLLSRMPSSA